MCSIIDDIGQFIFVEDLPAKSDAIMIVGGSHPEAGEIAAALWKQGFAPKILVGGGVSIKTGKFPGPKSKSDIYDGDYATECEFYTDVLLKNGVPERAILGEDRSSFTRDNAMQACRLAAENSIVIHKALLVCKAFHARRSLMFYQASFPETEFLVIPFAGFDLTRHNWFASEYGIQRVLGELKRCGEQFGAEDIQKFR